MGGGLLLISLTLLDLIWTTLGTHGGGPITGRLTGVIWVTLVKFHRRHTSHRALSFAGSFMLAFVYVFWMALLWTGCFVLFSAKPAAVVDAHTRRVASAEERWYFVGYSVFTYGNGDLVPNGPWWRFAAVLVAAIGLGALTLAITFLMQVLSSVVMKRTLAAYISDIGGTANEILMRSWTGERFYGLDGHTATIGEQLHLVTEQHLAYPILQYFHSEKLRTASTVRVAALYEMAQILEEGVAPHLRLPRITIYPLLDALTGYQDVLAGAFAKPAATTPPPPSLDFLRDLGVETVDDATFAGAVERVAKTRRFFLGLVREDGWEWSDIMRR